jgi:hypothetical protein
MIDDSKQFFKTVAALIKRALESSARMVVDYEYVFVPVPFAVPGCQQADQSKKW